MSGLNPNAAAWEPQPKPPINWDLHAWVIRKANPTLFQLLFSIAASLSLGYTQWGDEVSKIRGLILRGADPFQQMSNYQSVATLFLERKPAYFNRLLDLLEGLGPRYPYSADIQYIKMVQQMEDPELLRNALNILAKRTPTLKRNGTAMNPPKHLAWEEELNNNQAGGKG